MKHILIQFNFSNTDRKVYEEIIHDLEIAGLGNIPERIFHIAAPNGSDWHITDVWESFESFNRFAERMIPIFIQNGGKRVDPILLPVHNIIVPELHTTESIST